MTSYLPLPLLFLLLIAGSIVLLIGVGNDDRFSALLRTHKDQHRGRVLSRMLENDPRTVMKKNTNSVSLDGLRILLALACYDMSNFFYLIQVVKGFRDLCQDGGSHVTIVIDTADDLPIYILKNIAKQCKNGKMKIALRKSEKSIKLKLTWLHRETFYDNLDDYDLFIYNEGDHLIRQHHVQYFLDETEKIRSLVTPEKFNDYAVGFIRYEINAKGERVLIDNNFSAEKVVLMEQDEGVRGHYIHPSMPYQGLFMALPEQLVAWRDSPRCKFDRPPMPEPQWVRRLSKGQLQRAEKRNMPPGFLEQVNSLWLFQKWKTVNEPYSNHGCGVHQLIPLVGFEDCLVHHISNKYNSIFPAIQPVDGFIEIVDKMAEDNSMQ